MPAKVLGPENESRLRQAVSDACNCALAYGVTGKGSDLALYRDAWETYHEILDNLPVAQ